MNVLLSACPVKRQWFWCFLGNIRNPYENQWEMKDLLSVRSQRIRESTETRSYRVVLSLNLTSSRALSAFTWGRTLLVMLIVMCIPRVMQVAINISRNRSLSDRHFLCTRCDETIVVGMLVMNLFFENPSIIVFVGILTFTTSLLVVGGNAQRERTSPLYKQVHTN